MRLMRLPYVPLQGPEQVGYACADLPAVSVEDIAFTWLFRQPIISFVYQRLTTGPLVRLSGPHFQASGHNEPI